MNREKRERVFPGYRRCTGLIRLLSVTLLLALAAAAELGGAPASIQDDQAQMKATRRVISTGLFETHEIQSPTGTVVREYVSPAGVVFGVSWNGPFMPDLRQLLGRYYDIYVHATVPEGRGRGPLSIEEGGMVIETGGHPRSFHGRAYLPAMLPAGTTADVIK
jgi:Protein of unknown function (DUF2844)